MLKKFHMLAVEVAFNSMPVQYRKKYLTGFSFELLQEYADIPYVPSVFNEPEYLHLDHSYKLYLRGRDLHKIGEGRALEEVLNFAQQIQELNKQEKSQLVRLSVAKGTHYVIDIGTYPHVNEVTWDKYHAKFEDMAADWFDVHKHLVEELVQNYKPEVMKSVPNRARSIAENAYFASLDFLPKLKRGGLITDLQWATMCVKQVYAVMDWFATFERCL